MFVVGWSDLSGDYLSLDLIVEDRLVGSADKFCHNLACFAAEFGCGRQRV